MTELFRHWTKHSHLNAMLQPEQFIEIGERLAGDDEMRGWINGELQAAAPRLIERYREDIRGYIVARVQSWDAREMTDELERHIGRDLQFTRINGTLVGGLVGLTIHTVTQLLR